jgi:nucleotide-binding universal stress UspA family protein
MRIRTVLCPIDFSGLDERELAIALEVCRTFAAKLVLHHDLPAAEPGFSRAWDWAKAQQALPSEGEVAARMRALLDRVAGGVPAEAVVTTGALAGSVLALAERLPADLMVLGSHGWSTQDHASVTERVIDRAPCPVLTFQERSVAPPFRLRVEPGGPPRRALVPTDLTPGSAAAVQYACGLARHLRIEVELLHVMPDDATGAAIDHAYRVLDGFVPPDLADEVSARVRHGDPRTEIPAYAEVTAPTFVILGEHARGFVRHFFTTDTTQAVVRRIDCPAWIVPAAAAA